MIRELERSQLVRAPLEEVFAFFSDARNLEQLTRQALERYLRAADGNGRVGALTECGGSHPDVLELLGV